MKKTTILLLLLHPLLSFSQNDTTTLSKKEIRKERPAYLGFTAGFSYSSFRDFATSPLIYSGTPVYLSLSYLKADMKRESEFGISYSFGNYIKNFNKQYTLSQVKTFSSYYSRLYRLNKLSSGKFNTKIGGVFNITGNTRYNQLLMNNAVGAEWFANLMGSIKITKDISRTDYKDKKFLFIKYKLDPRTRNIAFRLNVGLINSSYRNGYAYLRHTLDQNDLYYGYQFNIFSGFRMSTALDYTVSLKNRNAIQFSYLWDAYKTGGDLDKFEMAHHTFKLTFLFNTNNR
jgi:hypothetical protein